ADKLYLALGKRLDPLAREEDGADRPALAHKRHAERGPHLSESDGQLRITWNGGHIVDMHRVALQPCPYPGFRPGRAPWKCPDRQEGGLVFRWKPEIQCQQSRFAVTAVDRRLIGVAQPRGGLDDSLEHRLDIEGSPADDLEHVARCCLIFERFF